MKGGGPGSKITLLVLTGVLCRCDANCKTVRWSVVLRFKLGSIKGSKKSGFGPYLTPPKPLRIFEFLVRDQEVGGSNPLAPTNQQFKGTRMVVERMVPDQALRS